MRQWSELGSVRTCTMLTQQYVYVANDANQWRLSSYLCWSPRKWSKPFPVFLFPFSILLPLLFCCFPHVQLRHKYPPDKSSYLISKVHTGSVMDQFPDDPNTPFPSCHHEDCLLRFLHRIQIIQLLRTVCVALNTQSHQTTCKLLKEWISILTVSRER